MEVRSSDFILCAWSRLETCPVKYRGGIDGIGSSGSQVVLTISFWYYDSLCKGPLSGSPTCTRYIKWRLIIHFHFNLFCSGLFVFMSPSYWSPSGTAGILGRQGRGADLEEDAKASRVLLLGGLGGSLNQRRLQGRDGI